MCITYSLLEVCHCVFIKLAKSVSCTNYEMLSDELFKSCGLFSKIFGRFITFTKFTYELRTLRTQDTSDPGHFGTSLVGPNCPERSALVPKCPKDSSDLSAELSCPMYRTIICRAIPVYCQIGHMSTGLACTAADLAEQ